MVIKIKNLLKRQDTSKIMINLKNIFYVDKEMRDIKKKKFYQRKRNLLILSIFSKNIIHTMMNFSTYTNILTVYSMMYHTLM